MGSGFQNFECEIVARNIVLMQKSRNPERWTDFTPAEYQAFCSYEVCDTELGVITAMADGGFPVPDTGSPIEGGYLERVGDAYRVTQQFIDALPAQTKGFQLTH